MIIVNDFEPKKIINMSACTKIEMEENNGIYNIVIYFLDGSSEIIAESSEEKEINKKFDKIANASSDMLSSQIIRFKK